MKSCLDEPTAQCSFHRSLETALANGVEETDLDVTLGIGAHNLALIPGELTLRDLDALVFSKIPTEKRGRR